MPLTPARLLAATGAAFALAATVPAARAQFGTVSTISTDPSGGAAVTNPNFIDPGSIAFDPNGGFVTGSGTFIDNSGNTLSPSITITSPPTLTAGQITGVTFNPTGDFTIPNGSGAIPSSFIFANSNGTISAFNPTITPTPTSTVLVADQSNINAQFRGITTANTSTGNQLFLPDFANNRIAVFDNSFAPVTTPSTAFRDTTLPAGYAPYSINNINGQIYVTYAQRNGAGGANAGVGMGYVDVYDTQGNLVSRFATGGQLNAPSAVVLAPSNFGQFSNDILIANSGNGQIGAYDPTTGAFVGALSDASNNPISINNLTGLSFGNGGSAGPLNTLFYTAGDGTTGSFGAISVIPAPTAAVALAGSALTLVGRRRRRA